MRSPLVRSASWLVGVAGIIGIAWYFRPQDFGATVAAIGVTGLIQWILLTLAARLILAETTVAPLKALGFEIRHMDAFWIGWIRTFANQILPFAGIAAYAQAVRTRVRISWSELLALATPQYVLAAAALGIVGLAATATNANRLHVMTYGLAAAYLTIILVSIAVTTGAGWFIESLPHALSSRASKTAAALRILAQQRNLIVRLILCHGLAIVLRGGRLWVLFAAAGFQLDWRELLLVIAITESTLLVQLTPGGLGIREAAVLGGSALLSIPAPVAASVAIVDRLLVIAITTLLAAPALVLFRGDRTH